MVSLTFSGMDRHEICENVFNENKGFVTQLQETACNLELAHVNDDQIEAKLFNIRAVMKALLEKAKCVEERRKLLETKNVYLQNENADLAKRYIQSLDEIKLLNVKVDELKVKDVKNKSTSMPKLMFLGPETVQSNFKRSKADKAVTCHILLADVLKKNVMTTATQTEACIGPKSTASLLQGFSGLRTQRSEMILSSKPGNNEPVIVMTKKELQRLDSNMESLRMKLEMKEEAWAKTGEREREQRFKLSKLTNEMTALKKVSESRTQELKLTTRDLKLVTSQLDQAEKEIKQLKKVILKTRTAASSNTSPQVSWSTAVINQINMADGNGLDSFRKRKLRSKKTRQHRDHLGQQERKEYMGNGNTDSYIFLNETYMSEKNDKDDMMDLESSVTSVQPQRSIKGNGKCQLNQVEPEIYAMQARPYTTVRTGRKRHSKEEITSEMLQKFESDTLIKSFDPL